MPPSKKVTIVLRIGPYNFHREKLVEKYDGFEHLDGVEIKVDPNMTWVDAIKNASVGVPLRLSPRKFFIRRHSKKYPSHEITERVKQLITEDFGKPKSDFGFHVCLVRKLKTANEKKEKAANEKEERDSTISKMETENQKETFILKSVTSTQAQVASPEIIPLNNKILENVDTNLSWNQAFLKCFKIQLDPERYFIRRYIRTRNLRRQIPIKPEHDLRDRICVLLQDYAKVNSRGHYNILLVDREGPPLPGYLNLGQSQPTSKKSEQPVEKVTRPKLILKRRLVPLMHRLKIRSSPPKERENVENEPPLPQWGQRRVETDAMSSVSFESQESQSQAGLEEDGIQYEDVRDEVYKVAQKFTNKQLVMARKELLKLKNDSRKDGQLDTWSQWITYCPLPASLIRDLLDV